MKETPARILVVEDHAPFRRLLSTTLQRNAKLEVVGEASNGLDAIQKSQDLKPVLILLDIGLPDLNGIEVTRRIRSLSSKVKILIVSGNCSADVIAEALRSGADGYVIKSDIHNDLTPAVESVIQGTRFISPSIAARDRAEFSVVNVVPHTDSIESTSLNQSNNGEPDRRHNACIYSEERWLLEDMLEFIGGALKAENAAIVIATESHRSGLKTRLEESGFDVDAATAQGRYIVLDADESLSRFMVNGMIDPLLFMNVFGTLIMKAATSERNRQLRVAIFGECVGLLLAQGNVGAAIQMERLGNELAQKYDIEILCGYSEDNLGDLRDGLIYRQVCAQHSTVHSR